ncbi:DNA polymerase III subunit delta [Candidatus Peregrinibacteria bacterium]|nr:DNA polymerase III subunit delta [Candidatus Peregrinibacteria bacterium]
MTIDKKTIYLFYGDDRYSLSQKLKFWQEEFIKKYGESSLEIIDGEKLDPADFATNLEALPFLSEKRLILVKDFLENGKAEKQKQVTSAIENTGEFCILIFQENEVPEKTNPLYKKIAKIGHLEEFKNLSPNEITQWIMDKAKKDKLKISFFTANYLNQQCGPELWTISNELEKLVLFANGQEITKEMIDNLCIPSLTSSIFKLTDEVAQKNVKGSLKTFGILKNSGEDLVRIFFMLTRHFRILAQVQELVGKGETASAIIKKLKQHPFVIQKTSQQAKNFDQSKLKKIYEEMLKIDTGLKTGIIKSFKGDNREYELAIEKFIINCCQ